MFVAAVWTIGNSVTFIRFLNTLLEICAFELRCGTRNGRATFFVLIVEAIVVAVANPRLRDAVTRSRTSKLKKKVILKIVRFSKKKKIIHT